MMAATLAKGITIIECAACEPEIADLANFGIEVEMGEVSVGPTVTQYTMRPAVGVSNPASMRSRVLRR